MVVVGGWKRGMGERERRRIILKVCGGGGVTWWWWRGCLEGGLVGSEEGWWWLWWWWGGRGEGGERCGVRVVRRGTGEEPLLHASHAWTWPVARLGGCASRG